MVKQMNKLDTLYNEGKKLMEQAIDCYSKNKITEAEEYRKKANELYNKADILYCIENTDRDKLYGKNRNFGICYQIFEDSLLKNLNNRNGKKFINEVSNLIKNNKVLKEQFNIYNSICNKKNVSNPESYVDGVLEYVSKLNINKNDIRKANEKLIDLIESNANVNKLLDIDDDTLKLYEEIDFILTNKKSINNIDEYNKIKNSLVEKFDRDNKDNPDNNTVNENYETSLSEITEKYKDLTDDEIKLIEGIISSDKDKSSLFEEYKSETIGNIDEAIKNASDGDKEQWLNIKEALSEKKYNKDSLIDDILKFVEIQKEI